MDNKEIKNLVKCASCGTEKPVDKMRTCMDSRPMHRYVCDGNCMAKFYGYAQPLHTESK